MIEAGKFVCPSCSKDSTIDNAIDVLGEEEFGPEGSDQHLEDLCKKCGKCKCNVHDWSTCCKCSWSEIQKEFNNPLLYKSGSWCRWKYRPVILFEMCEEEEVRDISLFSEKINISRDYRIKFEYAMEDGNGNSKELRDLNRDDDEDGEYYECIYSEDHEGYREIYQCKNCKYYSRTFNDFISSKDKIKIENLKKKIKDYIKNENSKISDKKKELSLEKAKSKTLEEIVNVLKSNLKSGETPSKKLNSNEFIESLLKKDKEIEELKEKLSRYPFELKKGEKMISIIIQSIDQNFLCTVICKDTDKFLKIENKLSELKKFEEYLESLESEIYFVSNGIKINKYKSLKENGIKDNDTILVKNVEC
jgi:hypothetical protein